MMHPVLEIRNVSKSFPGVKALDDVSFAINKGEVVGLIGENGAGKSTLLKVLNGIYQPDAGGIFVDGNQVRITSPRQAFDSGIAMVFQEQSILPTLTVAENIFLGREEEFLRFGLISKSRMNAAAAEELKKVHLSTHPAMRCADLSFADRQMVEIAKALSLDSRISRPCDNPPRRAHVGAREEGSRSAVLHRRRSEAAGLLRLHLAPARGGA